MAEKALQIFILAIVMTTLISLLSIVSWANTNAVEGLEGESNELPGITSSNLFPVLVPFIMGILILGAVVSMYLISSKKGY